MRVKMRTVYAGERITGQPGAILDLPDVEASALIVGGYATAEDEPETIESAIIHAPETAVSPAQERKRGRKG